MNSPNFIHEMHFPILYVGKQSTNQKNHHTGFQFHDNRSEKQSQTEIQKRKNKMPKFF